MRTECVEPAAAASRVARGFTFHRPPGPVRSVPLPASAALDTPMDGGPESRIQQCITFMRQHLDQPLQVATLAARASTSPSHFFVLFKRVTGSPPIDYFIRLRMQRACQLLEAGLLPVKDVAAAVGYEDPFYFSRVFKSMHQVAPSHYRARSQSRSWT
jgi:transcriptional regulator GlxA family with amidase domain